MTFIEAAQALRCFVEMSNESNEYVEEFCRDCVEGMSKVYLNLDVNIKGCAPDQVTWGKLRNVWRKNKQDGGTEWERRNMRGFETAVLAVCELTIRMLRQNKTMLLGAAVKIMDPANKLFCHDMFLDRVSKERNGKARFKTTNQNCNDKIDAGVNLENATDTKTKVFHTKSKSYENESTSRGNFWLHRHVVARFVLRGGISMLRDMVLGVDVSDCLMILTLPAAGVPDAGSANTSTTANHD